MSRMECTCGHAWSSHKQDPNDPYISERCKTCGCAAFDNAQDAKMQSDDDPTPTEPGTPQTAADERWLLLVQELFLGRHDPQYTVGEHRPLIEKAIRSARDAEVRAAVETMPTARIISQWDLVSRKAVLAILDADTPS